MTLASKTATIIILAYLSLSQVALFENNKKKMKLKASDLLCLEIQISLFPQTAALSSCNLHVCVRAEFHYPFLYTVREISNTCMCDQGGEKKTDEIFTACITV